MPTQLIFFDTESSLFSSQGAINSYTKSGVREILDLALENHLDVIPLVQTFGHMEHVLKTKEFSQLREVPQYPQSICPSKNESLILIKSMIDQIVRLHQDRLQFLHIGCDEVYHLATCPQCQSRLKRLNQNRLSKNDPLLTGRFLFLDHVKQVASYVRETYGIQPLIWDDMLRAMPATELSSSGIGDLVEPVIWVYGEDIDAFIDGQTWQKYSNTFSHVWAASAFKERKRTLPIEDT